MRKYFEGICKHVLENIRLWLSFEEENVLSEQRLEDDWITVVDEYYQQAGRIAEQKNFRCPYLKYACRCNSYG
jgi:hypothetical protein